jgi:hypothetical protein
MDFGNSVCLFIDVKFSKFTKQLVIQLSKSRDGRKYEVDEQKNETTTTFF